MNVNQDKNRWGDRELQPLSEYIIFFFLKMCLRDDWNSNEFYHVQGGSKPLRPPGSTLRINDITKYFIPNWSSQKTASNEYIWNVGGMSKVNLMKNRMFFVVLKRSVF